MDGCLLESVNMSERCSNGGSNCSSDDERCRRKSESSDCGLMSKYSCTLFGCQFVASSLQTFERHCVSEHSKSNGHCVTCGLCGQSMKGLDMLSTHMEVSHMPPRGKPANIELRNGDQSWLYPCVLDSCHAAYECLADLRAHFITTHQSEGAVTVPCCFCMAEFATWNNATTAHIASHVHVSCIHCIECQLKFSSKASLMDHLTATHSGLPKGIRINVSIRGNERRCSHSGENSKELNGIKEAKGKQSSDVPWKSNNSTDVGTDSSPESSADVKVSSGKSSTKMCGDSLEQLPDKSDRSSDTETLHAAVGSDSNDMSNSSHGDTSQLAVSVHDGSSEDVNSADKNSSRAGRRKARKPTRVAIDEPPQLDLEERLDEPGPSAAEDELIEIMSASQALSMSCTRCTFTCNTHLQLKVHAYECHDKPRGLGQLSPAWFTCRQCGNVADTLTAHRKHIAHHQGTSSHTIRVFTCVYCDRRSDSMDVLENHVVRDHASNELKFEVQQMAINYLQDMKTCPVCSGSFAWKDDLLHHFGAVHRLEGLVAHLESTFPSEPCLASYQVPRNLFKNLLSPATKPTDTSGKSACQSDSKQVKWKDISKWTREDGVDDDEEAESASGNSNQQQNAEYLTTSARYPKCEPVQSNISSRADELSSTGSIHRFHCDQCEYSANDAEELNRHAAVHKVGGDIPTRVRSKADDVNLPLGVSGNKLKPKKLRYRCELCPFATSKSPNLKRHITIHTRAAQMTEGYRCGYCQFGHTKRSCVQNHMSRYHADSAIRFFHVINDVVVDVACEFEPAKTIAKSSAPKTDRPMTSLNQDQAPPVNAEPINAVFSSECSSDKDSSTAALEQQLPLSNIFAMPICCPLCDYSNRVRTNLVRHIRLYHGGERSRRVDDQCSTAMSDIREPHSKEMTIKHREIPSISPVTQTSPKDLSIRSPPQLSPMSISQPTGVFVPSIDDSVGQDIPFNISDILVPTPTLGSPKTKMSDPGGTCSLKSIPTSFYRCVVCGFQSAKHLLAKQHLLRVHLGDVSFACACCSQNIAGWRALMKHATNSHLGYRSIIVKEACDKHAAFCNENIEKIHGFAVARHARSTKETFEKSKESSAGQLTPLKMVLNVPTFTVSRKSPSYHSIDQNHLSTLSTADKELSNLKLDQSMDSPFKRELSISSEGSQVMHEPEGNVGRRGATPVVYECLHCQYLTDTATVMRHHVMAQHLDYRPFVCPYCKAAPPSVKSFPISKHVRQRHPEMAKSGGTFAYLRIDDMEQRLRAGYHMIPRDKIESSPNNPRNNPSGLKAASAPIECDGTDTDSYVQRKLDFSSMKRKHQLSNSQNDVLFGTPSESFGESDMPASSSTKASLYKCCFCSFSARSRADIRYHLMREIGYKPFRCGHCESGHGYAEPSRPALAKHLRSRHAGMTMDIIECRVEARDAEIARLLLSCAVSREKEPDAGHSEPDEAIHHADADTDPVHDVAEPMSVPAESATVSHVPSVECQVLAHVPKKKKKKRLSFGNFNGTRVRRCQHCAFRTSNWRQLREHVIAKHGVARLCCSHCEFTEYYPSKMQRHWQKSHRDLPFAYTEYHPEGDAPSDTSQKNIEIEEDSVLDLSKDGVGCSKPLPLSIEPDSGASDSHEESQPISSHSDVVTNGNSTLDNTEAISHLPVTTHLISPAKPASRCTARKSTSGHGIVKNGVRSCPSVSEQPSSSATCESDRPELDDSSEDESSVDTSKLNMQPYVQLVDICWGLNICKSFKMEKSGSSD